MLAFAALVGLFYGFKSQRDAAARRPVPQCNVAKPVLGTGGGSTAVLLGEGALWDDEKQVLYSIDIVGGKIFVYDPIQQKNIHVIDLRMHIGACVRRAKPGVWHLVCGTSRGFCIVDVTTGKIVEWLEDPEAGIRTNRMNDGKCDPQGRFWCGSMGLKCETGFGSLYCLGTDLKVTRVRFQLYCNR